MRSPDETAVGQRPLLANIQYLRAAAAYLVVLYHARVLLPEAMGPSLAFGRAGVDLFFIISGFIIQHVAARDDVGRPGQFLTKRVIRVVPLYWALTLVVGVAGLLAPSLAGSGGTPDLSRILRSLFFAPYRDDTGEIHPVLFVGWTLNYEMFFYVVFGACLLVRDNVTRLLIVTAALVGLVVLGAVTRPQGAALVTYTSPLMLEFVAGLWLSFFWHRRTWAAPSPTQRTVLVGIVVVGALALIGSESLWPDLPVLLKWGVPAFAIVAAALALEKASSGTAWRHALLLGEASYAIYLVHPIVIKVITIVAGKLGVAHPAFPGLIFLLTLVVVGIAGVAFHLVVERPVLRALRHRLLPRAPRAIAVGA